MAVSEDVVRIEFRLRPNSNPIDAVLLSKLRALAERSGAGTIHQAVYRMAVLFSDAALQTEFMDLARTQQHIATALASAGMPEAIAASSFTIPRCDGADYATDFDQPISGF